MAAQSTPALASHDDASPTRLLTSADVGSLADWAESIHALRRAYSSPVTNSMTPPRAIARVGDSWLRSMTAASPSGEYFGTKQIAYSHSRGRVSYVITLIRRESAELAAIMDGDHVTGMRTAATSALFLDAATPSRPIVVGILGSGFEAWNHLQALRHIRAISSLRVFSPTPDHRAAFTRRATAEHGINADAKREARQVVSGADVVICAARARDEIPTLKGEWLEAGQTVVSIGSTTPTQREVDAETIAVADRIVADLPEEVVHDSGDFIEAKKQGIDFTGKVLSLSAVVSGQAPARSGPGDIVLFKSVGSALQDVVVAELILQRSIETGVGTSIPAPVRAINK